MSQVSDSPEDNLLARFFDGQSSRAQTVFVQIEAQAVTLLSQDGARLARWPVDSLFVLPREFAGQPFALSSDQMELSRLVDLDGRLEGAIRPLHLTRTGPSSEQRGEIGWPRLALIGGAAVISLVSAFFWGVPKLAGVIAENLPAAWESQLGDLVSEQIGKAFGMVGGGGPPASCTTPKGAAALDGIMAEFRASLPTPLPVRLEVWDSPVVNALALPGGRIILFQGMIQAAGNVDALGFVLAHEYAHLAMRHPTEVALQAAGGAALISLVVGDVGGGIALGGLAEYMATTGFTRGAEGAADTVALHLMQRGGWNLSPAADLFHRLAKSGPDDRDWAWLSTHPSLMQRAEELRRQSSPGGRDRSSLWPAIRDICD